MSIFAYAIKTTQAPDHVQQARMVQLCEYSMGTEDSPIIAEIYFDPADQSHWYCQRDDQGTHWMWHDTQGAIAEWKWEQELRPREQTNA